MYQHPAGHEKLGYLVNYVLINNGKIHTKTEELNI